MGPWTIVLFSGQQPYDRSSLDEIQMEAITQRDDLAFQAGETQIASPSILISSSRQSDPITDFEAEGFFLPGIHLDAAHIQSSPQIY